MIMKKSLVILAILMMAVPAMATVTITAVQEPAAQNCTEPNVVDISYVNTEPNYVRAFALDITADGDGNIMGISSYFVGECNSAKQGYGIFPGTIAINSSGTVTSYGTPVAPAADANALGAIGGKGITIEMGSLYTGTLHPANSGLLCKVYVTTKVGCNLHVALNKKRGGVVTENASANPTVALPAPAQVVACQSNVRPCNCTYAVQDDPDYVTLDDLNAILQALLPTKPDFYIDTTNPNYNACYDGSGIGAVTPQGYVTLDDLNFVLSILLPTKPDFYVQCPDNGLWPQAGGQ